MVADPMVEDAMVDACLAISSGAGRRNSSPLESRLSRPSKDGLAVAKGPRMALRLRGLGLKPMGLGRSAQC